METKPGQRKREKELPRQGNKKSLTVCTESLRGEKNRATVGLREWSLKQQRQKGRQDKTWKSKGENRTCYQETWWRKGERIQGEKTEPEELPWNWAQHIWNVETWNRKRLTFLEIENYNTEILVTVLRYMCTCTYVWMKWYFILHWEGKLTILISRKSKWWKWNWYLNPLTGFLPMFEDKEVEIR